MTVIDVDAHFELAEVPEERRASFLGESIAGCYARMGDPLPIPSGTAA